jgi:hypothetical protein
MWYIDIKVEGSVDGDVDSKAGRRNLRGDTHLSRGYSLENSE